MITIDLGNIEYYDGSSNQFVYEEGGVVRFEYSLKVLYEWEGKWKKPFLKGGLTDEELMDFYMTMALDPVKEQFLTDDVMKTLAKYIGDSNTATIFTTSENGQNGSKQPSKGKIHTSEELYALMLMAQVPIEFEHRNLNRLLTILKVVDAYNKPAKKMSKTDIYKQNAEINRQRREQFKTKG